MSTLTIGANIERETISANAQAAFAGVHYPVTVTLENQTPRTLILPEVKIHLAPGATQDVTFPDAGRMRRTVSSFAQIAHLTSASPLVSIAVVNNRSPQPEAPAHHVDSQPAETPTEKVDVVADDGERFVVRLNGVTFEPARNQVRDDGTLTPGGRKAYQAAKGASN